MTAPGAMLRLLGGANEERIPKRIIRVLGARHLAQAGVERVFGEVALPIGVSVDALHALTGFVFALVDERWRRAALADAAITSGLAVIGRGLSSAGGGQR